MFAQPGPLVQDGIAPEADRLGTFLGPPITLQFNVD